MRTLALALILVTAGCATTSRGMLDTAPVVTLTSNKTVPQLEGCIALALSSMGNPSSFPNAEGGRTMVYGEGGLTIATINLRPGPPATIDVHKGFALAAKWRNRIRGCA